MSFAFVYLSLISILLFNMLIVGIYLEINGIPMILCLISVIWNICLNGLVKILFCSIVLVGEEIIEFFQSLPMLILVLLLVYWRFQEVLALGVRFLFHSMWNVYYI